MTHDLTWPDFTWMYLYSAFKMNFSETVPVSEQEWMQLFQQLICCLPLMLTLAYVAWSHVPLHYAFIGENQFETFTLWIYYISWLWFLRGWIFLKSHNCFIFSNKAMICFWRIKFLLVWYQVGCIDYVNLLHCCNHGELMGNLLYVVYAPCSLDKLLPVQN